FVQPEFHGDDEDHKDFVDKFISYITLAGLENVLDNSGIGTTIAHIRGANAGGITGAVASFSNVPLGLTGTQIISAQNVAEDWTIAGECTTNTVLVAPNAEGEIGVLRQGVYESVSSFWAKIQKYGDQLGYTPVQKKTHFLSGVRPDIRDEIYRISQTKSINDIIDSLAELELHHGILQQVPSQPHHAPIAPAIPD
ncbi:23730_t:CDS:2, partial [Racocetra persica]